MENANKLLEIIDEHGSIHQYIRSLDVIDFDERLKALSKNFKFFGDTAAGIFLYSSGEDVSEMMH